MHVRTVLCNVVLLMVMLYLVTPISCSGNIDENAAIDFKIEVAKMVVKAKHNENFQIRLDTEAGRVAISEAKKYAANNVVFNVGKFEELSEHNGMKKLKMIATYKLFKAGAIEDCVKNNKDKLIEAVQTGFNVACFGKGRTLHFVLVTRTKTPVVSDISTMQQPTAGKISSTQIPPTTDHPTTSPMSSNGQPDGGNISTLNPTNDSTAAQNNENTKNAVKNVQSNSTVHQPTVEEKPMTGVAIQEIIPKVSEFQATPNNGKAAEGVKRGLTKIFAPAGVGQGKELPEIEEIKQDERTKLWSDLRKEKVMIGSIVKYKLEEKKVSFIDSKLNARFKLDSGVSFGTGRQNTDIDITRLIASELPKLKNKLQDLTKFTVKIRFAVETVEFKKDNETWPMIIILFNPIIVENAKQPVNNIQLHLAVEQGTTVAANPETPAETIESKVKDFVTGTFGTNINAVIEMTTEEREEIHKCVKDATKTKISEKKFAYCFIFTVGPDGKSTLREMLGDTQFPGTTGVAIGDVITDSRFQSIANKTPETCILERIDTLLKEAKEAVEFCASRMDNVQWAVEYLPLEIKGKSSVYFVLVLNKQ